MAAKGDDKREMPCVDTGSGRPPCELTSWTPINHDACWCVVLPNVRPFWTEEYNKYRLIIIYFFLTPYILLPGNKQDCIRPSVPVFILFSVWDLLDSRCTLTKGPCFTSSIISDVRTGSDVDCVSFTDSFWNPLTTCRTWRRRGRSRAPTANSWSWEAANGTAPNRYKCVYLLTLIKTRWCSRKKQTNKIYRSLSLKRRNEFIIFSFDMFAS